MPVTDGRNIVGLPEAGNYTDHFTVPEVKTAGFNWVGIGQFSIDATENAVDFIKSTYDQNITGSTPVQARIIDKTEGGSTPGRSYFIASATNTAPGMHYLTYAADNALPATGDVTLEVQMRKTGGAPAIIHDSTFGKFTRKA